MNEYTNVTSEVALGESSTAVRASDWPPARRLGPLSGVARRGKVKFFLQRLPKDARILDVGCADNWFKRAAAKQGWRNVVGLDLVGSADIVGNVLEWRSLGLDPHSFDAIVAFEVVEHGDFSLPFHELLKPEGRLMLTTPVPRFDPLCRFLEALRLLQQRTSPHTHLVDLRRFPRFEVVERRIKVGISQWAILRPLPDWH
jgi:2-polyprenyl-3-methyl-5-hydroxy-6-metoxy-1,4-benzoquinol methylase